jgi:AbrB family looped-hinge helix DNA binding protein
MKTTLDRFGRVVIPKEIRDKLGLKPGAEIEIGDNGNEVIVKPLEDETPLEIKDGVLIYTGSAAGDLEDAVRKHREERLSKFVKGKKG